MKHFAVSVVLICPSNWTEVDCRNYVKRLTATEKEWNTLEVKEVPPCEQSK